MSILDVVLDRRPEPKEEGPKPFTMYGEDYDMEASYWQEPVLTVEELFPEEHEEHKPRTKHDHTIPVVEPLSTYRQYRNNQF